MTETHALVSQDSNGRGMFRAVCRCLRSGYGSSDAAARKDLERVHERDGVYDSAMRIREIVRDAWWRRRLDASTEETLLSDGVRVVWTDRGVYEDGRVLWLRIYGSPSPWYARNVAERFGRITESDEAEDGSRSFSVLRPASVE